MTHISMTRTIVPILIPISLPHSRSKQWIWLIPQNVKTASVVQLSNGSISAFLMALQNICSYVYCTHQRLGAVIASHRLESYSTEMGTVVECDVKCVTE